MPRGTGFAGPSPASRARGRRVRAGRCRTGRKRGGAGGRDRGTRRRGRRTAPGPLVAEGAQLAGGALDTSRSPLSLTTCACQRPSPGRRREVAQDESSIEARGSSGAPSHSLVSAHVACCSRPTARAASSGRGQLYVTARRAPAASISASAARAAAQLGARPRALCQQLPPGGDDLVDGRPVSRLPTGSPDLGEDALRERMEPEAVARGDEVDRAAHERARTAARPRAPASSAGSKSRDAATRARRTGFVGSCACSPTSRSTHRERRPAPRSSSPGAGAGRGSARGC